MNGLTDCIRRWPWVNIVIAWFVLVDHAYHRLVAKRARPFRASGPARTFSDSEVISVGLIIETFFQGHEELGYIWSPQVYEGVWQEIKSLSYTELRTRLISTQAASDYNAARGHGHVSRSFSVHMLEPSRFLFSMGSTTMQRLEALREGPKRIAPFSSM